MYGWPYYSENKIAAVTAVLRSAMVTYWTDDECQKYVEAFAEYNCRNHTSCSIHLSKSDFQSTTG